MVPPFEAVVKMQLSMCEGWTRLAIETFTAYQRLFEHQAKFFHQPHSLRCRDVTPQGADWSENYGKRTGDVNVERV